MSAYIVAQINVRDMDAYRNYTQAVPATLALYDGKFIVQALDDIVGKASRIFALRVTALGTLPG